MVFWATPPHSQVPGFWLRLTDSPRRKRAALNHAMRPVARLGPFPL